jgi:hypothetical protein
MQMRIDTHIQERKKNLKNNFFLLLLGVGMGGLTPSQTQQKAGHISSSSSYPPHPLYREDIRRHTYTYTKHLHSQAQKGKILLKNIFSIFFFPKMKIDLVFF